MKTEDRLKVRIYELSERAIELANNKDYNNIELTIIKAGLRELYFALYDDYEIPKHYTNFLKDD